MSCPYRPLLGSVVLLAVLAGPLAAQPRRDALGDVLPAGALIRFGTIRFRTGHSPTALAFAPNHTTLAAVDGDAVFLWDAAGGQPLRCWREPWVDCVAFAPDGKT